MAAYISKTSAALQPEGMQRRMLALQVTQRVLLVRQAPPQRLPPCRRREGGRSLGARLRVARLWFSWLTCTNAGASEVCAAALKVVGVSTAALAGGYACDPNSKSELRIVAQPGVVIRLTRNFDKQRGFVNGAVAVVCESLRGNEVFTARLLGTCSMVLLHPMTESGIPFFLDT